MTIVHMVRRVLRDHSTHTEMARDEHNPTPTPIAHRARQPNLRLGHYLLAIGVITHEQLSAALAEQARRIADGVPIALGDLLVQQGALAPRDLVTALMLQQLDRQRNMPDRSSSAPLGELLVQSGVISTGQLAAALTTQIRLRQQGEDVLLGQILIAQGALSQSMLASALRDQRRNADRQEDD
jgi:hypothetical protein